MNICALKCESPSISIKVSLAILVHIYRSVCLIDSDWIYFVSSARVWVYVHYHTCAFMGVIRNVGLQWHTCQSTTSHVSSLLPHCLHSVSLSHCTLLPAPGHLVHRLPSILFHWHSRSASPFLAFTWVLEIQAQVFMLTQQGRYHLPNSSAPRFGLKYQPFIVFHLLAVTTESTSLNYFKHEKRQNRWSQELNQNDKTSI